VGEIADEHDEDTLPGVVRQSDGSFLADARANLEDVTSIVGAEFDVGEVAQEVDTLAGYVATRIGRVPVRGELVPGPGPFELEILDADPRRVKKLKIYHGLHRQNGQSDKNRELRQVATTASTPAPPNAPAPTSASTPSPSTPTSATPAAPQLPVTNGESAKLSPDAAPSKSARQP
jgi:hemolysin (HlyC) family protein